jgi:hypothetical protein
MVNIENLGSKISAHDTIRLRLAAGKMFQHPSEADASTASV